MRGEDNVKDGTMSEERQAESGQEVECAPEHERIPSMVAMGGHPLHPMLITFPIAFFIGAFVTDALWWWTRAEFWAYMSFWLLAGGLIGGTLAALSGTADFLLVPQIREHVTSWNHFIWAILAMSMGATNFMLRWDDPLAALVPWGIFTSALTVVALSAAGWLGGNLVFRYLIGTGSH
jgi:uncharacterized membrane protein